MRLPNFFARLLAKLSPNSPDVPSTSSGEVRLNDESEIGDPVQKRRKARHAKRRDIIESIKNPRLRRHMQLAFAQASLERLWNGRNLQARHQRGLWMRITSTEGKVPASVVRRDAFFSDPWWSRIDIKKPEIDGVVDKDTKPRADGSALVSERRYDLTLLDGRKLLHVRRVLVSPRGRRFKEFLLQETDGRVVSIAEVFAVLPLYRMERVDPAVERDVVVTEGVAAAEALIGMNISAVATLTGALHTPSSEALAPLARFRTVFLWPDNDSIGVAHMERVAHRAHGVGVKDIRVIRWTGGPRKGDAADFQEAEAGVRNLMTRASHWTAGSPLRARGQLTLHTPRMPVVLSLPRGAQTPMPRLEPPGSADTVAKRVLPPSEPRGDTRPSDSSAHMIPVRGARGTKP